MLLSQNDIVSYNDFTHAPEHTPIVCGGFIAFYPSIETRKIVENLTNWQSDVIDYYSKQYNNNTYMPHAANEQSKLTYLIQNNKLIKLAFLSNKKYANGKWYDEQKLRTDDIIWIHNNWIAGNDNKMERAKKWNHWFLNHQNGMCATQNWHNTLISNTQQYKKSRQSSISVKRRKIYIDVGTFDGDTLYLFDQLRSDAKEFIVYAWECDILNVEKTIQTIRGQNEKYRFNVSRNAYRAQFDINFIPFCAWTEDTELTFDTDGSVGSHIDIIDGNHNNHPKSVPARNFTDWFYNNIDKNDYIYLKLDIECAEFYIIPLLLQYNIIDYIDELSIEWHEWLSCATDLGTKFTSLKEYRLYLDKQINETGLIFQYAVPPCDGCQHMPKTFEQYAKFPYDRDIWPNPYLNCYFFRNQSDTMFKSPWDGLPINVNNIHASNSETKIQIQMLNESQIRVYIMGSGHCGSSFMQQFIGEVVLEKSKTFYLFEPTHTKIIELLRCHGYHKNDAFLLISDFFQCKFIDKCNYNSFVHAGIIKKINFGQSEQRLTAATLRNKCTSSKYLIYKDLLYYLYGKNEQNIHKLYTKFTNMTVINLVRNPLYQIISVSRWNWPPWAGEKEQKKFQIAPGLVIEPWINDICVHQPLFHELFRNVTNKSVVIKMEQFFKNITGSLNKTILYFYNLIMNDDRIEMTDAFLKYGYMKQNQWDISRPHPVQKNKYKQMETQLNQIANHIQCQKFANKYNYILEYQQLID
eukprot:69313_1